VRRANVRGKNEVFVVLGYDAPLTAAKGDAR